MGFHWDRSDSLPRKQTAWLLKQQSSDQGVAVRGAFFSKTACWEVGGTCDEQTTDTGSKIYSVFPSYTAFRLSFCQCF